MNLSVEEQNLAALPFAVLERRVGKRIGKLELKGTKVLPDGRELHVTWQVQGNNELGLPTEQDLDIFVALGVLTFQRNFTKTVTFSGREIARILNIGSVHGKFYQRLKVAMDRFIPLRFRAIAESEHQEDVKWLNVFQEASFSLDRSTGRCVGSITWTDKLIQSMDSGFFRLLDAGRYMDLDGITAKHLYRYLAVAFEKSGVVIIDARKLAIQHLGILNPPRYFSRLMQTLEPALEQVKRIEVVSSYHVVSTDDWTIGIQRHPGYVGESKALLDHEPAEAPELNRSYCRRMLEKAGLPTRLAGQYAEAAVQREDFYRLERVARLLQGLREQDVLANAATAFMKRVLESGADTTEGRELLDNCEIALEVCRRKQSGGQQLKNPAGFVMKILKDPQAREKLVNAELAQALKETFRQREQAALRQQKEAEQRTLLLQYEAFCRQLAWRLFEELSEEKKRALRKEKADVLDQQGRFGRIAAEQRPREIDELIVQDLVKTEAPPFERWYLRQRAQQAVLPFEDLQPIVQ